MVLPRLALVPDCCGEAGVGSFDGVEELLFVVEACAFLLGEGVADFVDLGGELGVDLLGDVGVEVGFALRGEGGTLASRSAPSTSFSSYRSYRMLAWQLLLARPLKLVSSTR